jgi:hypothetical protein
MKKFFYHSLLMSFRFCFIFFYPIPLLGNLNKECVKNAQCINRQPQRHRGLVSFKTRARPMLPELREVVILTRIFQSHKCLQRTKLINSQPRSAGHGKTRSSPSVNAVLLKIPAKRLVQLCSEFLQYGRAGGELFCLDFFVSFCSNGKKKEEETTELYPR